MTREQNPPDVLDIFCDESGFTGENLLNKDQRFFTYGSVAISPSDASTLVAQTIKDFRVQGRELKGRKLLKYSSGRRAAMAVIRQLEDRSQVVIVHKKYALACKLFEYAFEPLIADVSTALYSTNFHKFIANIVYMSDVTGHPRTRELAERFEEAVRGDAEPLRRLLSVHSPTTRDPVEAVISFCIYHRDIIFRELVDAKEAVRWVLDVTASALNSLLTTWGRRAQRLRVTCDESGPLASMVPHFDGWIGNNAKRTFNLGDRQVDFGFNLVNPIALAKSHDTPESNWLTCWHRPQRCGRQPK